MPCIGPSGSYRAETGRPARCGLQATASRRFRSWRRAAWAPRWDCETADVLYWERYRGRDSAGPEAPAIPTIAGKSLQIPNFSALPLFC
jgi:hypothetical protein